MPEPHRYALDRSSKKYDCPECSKKKFVRYMDSTTREYLPDRYGRCDREAKCGYYLSPKADGYAKMIWESERGNHVGNWKPTAPPVSPPRPLAELDPVFIPPDVLRATLKGYGANVFLQSLMQRVAFPFTDEDISKVVSQYYLGTTNRGFWAGAITFPYIDIHHRTRAIQVKKFDEQNHTVKTTFIHSIVEKHHRENNKPLPDWIEPYKNNDLKVSCPFGEHLLTKYPNNPVAVVEAPKTALYGTLYFGFPDNPESLLWLAAYNLSSLNYEKCKELKGRRVYLFPDLSKDGTAYEQWSRKAEELQRLIPGSRFKVSDLLEKGAEQQAREDGADLADYLIRLDWRKFRQPTTPAADETTQPAQLAPGMHTLTNREGVSFQLEINEHEYPAIWDA